MIEGAIPEATTNRLNYYKVQLQNEWMGNPKGSELTLMEPVVRSLLNRGTAKLVVTTKKKELEGPPKDKMMKKSRKVRTKTV